MRKLLISAALLVSTTFTGCSVGPHQLARTVDDWDNSFYAESPWLDALLTVIPVIPLARFGAQVGDFFIGDAYAFWVKDAWVNKGTGFKHAPDPTGKTMQSMVDGGKWLEIKGGDAK